nr:hypothetical protein [Tanacetum cinerariifolium]
MRIDQYFLMTDYSLWKVILNGYSRVPTRIVKGVVSPVAPTTVEQKLARKNELKARGTLLMALPDKHQLKFNSHKDAKTLMEAIEKRFGGNTETKKIQKTLLNLPSEWKTHTLIWRNKADLEEQSLDDLFNSLKIYEAEVKHSSSIVECYNCHRKGHFARECRSPTDSRRNGAVEPQRRTILVETSTSNALVSQCDGVGSYESDCESWPPSSLYDMFQPSGGYHDVPSPTTRTFMPPKPNLVFHTVPIAVETNHSAFTIQLSPTKPAQDLSHTNRPTAPIIEDWVSDSEDEFETKALQIIPILTPSKPVFITGVKPVSAVVPKIKVTRPRLAHPIITKSKSPIKMHITRIQSPKTSNSPPRVTAVEALVVSVT